MTLTSSRLRLRLALTLAAACAGTAAQAQHCGQGVCLVQITVQACDSGTMTASPDPVLVPAPNNMVWTIAGRAYKFADNGIVIDGSGFEPRPGVSDNGARFVVHNSRSDTRPDIKYTVNLIRVADGVACAPFDPLINNH